MKANLLINQVKTALRQAIKEIQKSDTPLPKKTVQQILDLQHQIIELRDEAIVLHRECDWTLEEVGVAFEVSSSRVSQIARNIHRTKSRRIRLHRRPR